MKQKKISRIGELLIAKQLTHKAVAQKLGVSDQAVGRWARGEALPTPEKQKALSLLLSCSIEELNKRQQRDGSETADDDAIIPIVAAQRSVSAGEKDLVRMIKVSKNWILSRVPAANTAMLQLVTPVDDSMAPTIPSTGFAIVDQSICSLDRDGVFFFEVNGQRYIKRIQRMIDGSISIISDNPKYPIQRIPASDASKLTVLGLCIISCTASPL